MSEKLPIDVPTGLWIDGSTRQASDGGRFDVIDPAMLRTASSAYQRKNSDRVLDGPAAPFGGMKQSGIGREGAHVGMMEYLETQYVSVTW